MHCYGAAVETGRVKFFDMSRSYGFLEFDGDAEDALIHVSALREANIDMLPDGATVTASVLSRPNGRAVVSIASVDMSTATPRKNSFSRMSQLTVLPGWEEYMVKWFDKRKGYGFLVPIFGGADVFVHAETARENGFLTLTAGQRLHAEIGKGSDGKLAAVRLRPPQ